jgi:hypothetical protein
MNFGGGLDVLDDAIVVLAVLYERKVGETEVFIWRVCLVAVMVEEEKSAVL